MGNAGPLLVVLTGPSGAGKDSVLNRIRDSGKPYHFTVTATTRDPRPGEEHGIDYYFITREEFDGLIQNGELLEHAVVYGQQKGVPKEPVRKALREGKDVLMRTDIQGARFIKSNVPGTLTIFITVPSRDELKRRLTARAADPPDQIDVRLREAEAEMETADEFDYTVVNDDLDRCVDEIESILERDRSREDRQRVKV